MILLVFAAVLSGSGAMIALFPLGWLAALAGAPVAASLTTVIVALALAVLRSQTDGPVVSPSSAPATEAAIV